ncbi:hypothetical protein [Planctomyces sp. SH-PL62]|uniref:hypothetical protein n=1 Tax=Planctomyces sp. SH-PL62 TaxID=1636152 RepID=UPI00078BE74B|nr:hypothetical protein [Planctomyces sp. SH-PL62]AMV38732.1 hypothetical protein VT85_14935 [Planctomyces sp. SH-PL62]
MSAGDKRKIDLVLGLAAMLVLGMLTGIYTRDLPLGVEGEWEWPRVRKEPAFARLLIAATGVAAYGGLAVLGYRALGVSSGRAWREMGWVAGLTASAAALQVFIVVGAPEGFGPTKWAVIHCLRESTGYYEVARREAAHSPAKFLADYPNWIAERGADHLGTHPPGLIATYCGLLALMERNDAAADWLTAATPPSMVKGFEQVEAMQELVIPRADRAALYLASLITLLACAGTVAPIYLLARESLPPRFAWATAALWPLAPALNLFQPLADAGYPLLSATALAAAAWASRLRERPGVGAWASAGLATVSGVVMAFGMMFTLAFLPIGLIVALIVLTTRSIPWTRRFETIAWIGVGFLAGVAIARLATGADPFAVWWWNLHHNSRFYDGGRRSYLPWLLVNPVELAIAAGLPAVVWGLAGVITELRRVPRTFWCALAVVAITDLSGLNRGEVARLWIIFLPPLFTAAGAGLAGLGGGLQAVLVTILLTGVQTLGLQGLIQLVFPP